MRLKVLALCLLAGFGSSAAAQDGTQSLQQALKQIPQVVLSNPEAMQVVFMDVQAWRGLEKIGPSADGMRRLAFAQMIRPIESIGYGLDQWSLNAKVSFDDVSYFAGFGQAPFNISYWGLKDKQAVGKLITSLKQSDFATVDGGAPGLIANGADGQMDMKKANAKDPWRGMMGKSSFVLPLDTALIQASSAAGMKTLAQPTPSVADSEVVAASVAGLRAAVPSDRGQIVQAAVISPVMGLTAVDPAKVLHSSGGDIESAKRNMKAAVEANSRGIPAYFSGIIADAQIDNAPALVVSLSYADCDTAKQAVDGIGAAWKESMASAVEAKVSGRTVEAGKLCAAVVTLISPKAENAGNPILSQVMNRYMQRQFTLLQIGSAR
ncbi:hypothetical protein RAS12_11805 [Achromobacter seleniivolatilans]|uniref:Imelysin-like domain-containing protein n=1 Tax=Achromobacter seleniivolatilans TaxID=3047478 RepID=A0ABY9M7Q6_9BURK|nr:hypothetical protein [Achromobacter sp. R39]WMD23021.1 hypothetical protein RAS12_11805 [Achromobacter sp. R39]